MVALAVAGLTVLSAIGVFGYQKLLESTLAGKKAELTEAQSKINESTIQEFIDLRNRLTSGRELLANHIVTTQFLDVLESLTLQTVRFTSMDLVIAADRSARLEMSGTARNFNALAAQSNAFAGDKRIKRAIFSSITVEDGAVTFEMTADIDPRLLVEGGGEVGALSAPAPRPSAPAAPAAATTTRAATTTPRAATTTPSL